MGEGLGSRIALVVGAVAATVGVFHRAVFGGGIFVARDILRVYYPLHQYWAARVSQGQFPSWYPYDGLGQPFPGMVISAVFHPANLLYLVLPLGRALTVNVLACFPAAFLGAYALARRVSVGRVSALLAAVVYAFSGYFVCITNNLLYLMAAATVPWALWAADRFFVAPTLLGGTAAATLLASILLCGDVQSFLISCTLVLVVATARHQHGRAAGEAVRTGALLLLTAMLAAVQMVPAFEVATAGKLAAQNLLTAEAWSLHPLRLLDVALGPLFAGESGDVVGAAINRELLQVQRNNLWVNSLHLGLPALVLAGVGLSRHRRHHATWFVVSAVVVLTLLAMGKHAGVYALVFRLLPPWRVFRYPEKLFPYVALGVALGAAAGLDAIGADERWRWRAASAVGVGAVVCALLAAFVHVGGVFSHHLVPALWSGSPSPAALARLGATFTARSVETAVACTAVAGAVLFVRNGGRCAALVAVLVFLHLAIVNAPLYEVASPTLLTTPSAFAAAIRTTEAPFALGRARVYRLKGAYGTDYERDPALAALDVVGQYARTVTAALEPVTPALWGLEGANTYLPATSARVFELAADEDDWVARYTKLFGVAYVSLSRDDVADALANGGRVIAEDPALWLSLVQRRAMPRTYLARPRCVRDREAALALVAGDEFAPPGEAVVECTHPLPVASPEVTHLGQVAIVAYRPEHVEVEAVATADALLVLNDAFYPGWTVEVDGQPAEVLAANYAVRAVPLAPGAHRVVFSYRMPGLAVGAWVSALALSSSLGAGIVARARRR